MERREGPGFRMMPFSPTALLERRETLNLTPEQVTKLSGLESDFKTKYPIWPSMNVAGFVRSIYGE